MGRGKEGVGGDEDAGLGGARSESGRGGARSATERGAKRNGALSEAQRRKRVFLYTELSIT